MSEFQEDMFGNENGGEQAGLRPVLSEQDLFNELVRLNKEINTAKANITQLVIDCKYHKKSNPGGHDVKRVAHIVKSAVTFAAGDYEEKKDSAFDFFRNYEDITNYNG